MGDAWDDPRIARGMKAQLAKRRERIRIPRTGHSGIL